MRRNSVTHPAFRRGIPQCNRVEKAALTLSEALAKMSTHHLAYSNPCSQECERASLIDQLGNGYPFWLAGQI